MCALFKEEGVAFFFAFFSVGFEQNIVHTAMHNTRRVLQSTPLSKTLFFFLNVKAKIQISFKAYSSSTEI